jgi:UDP-N-acetylglucosamine:LPS N-acetylglucosamine transferase
MALVNKNAALIVPDNQVKTLLMHTILELINDEKKRRELEVNILKMGNKYADKAIAKQILKVID